MTGFCCTRLTPYFATDTAVPSVDELTGELNREKYHSRYKKLLRSTI